ncbi:MAG: c-type cytochrome [Chromatiales bacterium]|nr:c-type cytochrome [Chromatiales bacterium]
MKKILLTMTSVAILIASHTASADGQATYKATCQSCHATGAAGAPKFGDKAAWAPRIAKGIDALVQSSIKGVPGTAMMPKGMCNACSTDDLKAAVEYMVSQSK